MLIYGRGYMAVLASLISFNGLLLSLITKKICFQAYLLPDKSKNGKRKTKVKKHTLNPIFDETLKYYLPLSNVETKTLWVSVWHSDMFGRNDFLGEVNINLQGKIFDNPQPQWYTLQERVSFHLFNFPFVSRPTRTNNTATKFVLA